MVKTILDSFCVKSGIFCSRCEEKLKKGQITDLDVKVIRTITELEKENPPLQQATFHRAVEAGDIMAVMVDKKGMDAFLASGAKLAKSLGDKVGKRIRILSFGGDERDFLEELFTPFSILTINTIWLPDGSRETKVILTGRRPRHSPLDFEVVKKLAHELKGLTLRIQFEGY
jgi:transcription antitermination factor NusA-like protein